MLEIGWDKIIAIAATTLLALSSKQISDFLQLRAERKSLSRAIAGEIKAIIELGRIVKPGMNLETYIKKLKEMTDASDWENLMLPFVIRDVKSEDIYMNNVTKIGLLPHHVAEEVAQFYTFLFNMRSDLKAIENGDFNNRGRAVKIKLLEENLILWNTIEEKGLAVAQKLRKI